MYEAMARRYRPSTFHEVIGQEHVAQTLQNAIKTARVAHAYLFCGPHGCGKTSMARIFACALVCEQGPTDQPCGKCPICMDVLRGQDVDVQEIDGASNNGVEQVRALREQAGYIPSRARFKIYIIDEVHMLSVAAFNALLKTLEEPPAHVKFILATTDPHKILGTILSRCQRFDFRLVPPNKMSSFFKGLVERENASITDDALDAVAAFSGGSMRDGLVLLDQLVSYAQGEVTREDVEQVRGVAGAQAVAGIYESILCHDIARALGIVDEVAARGTSVGDFLDQLIDYGRDIMYVCGTGKMENITAYGPARSLLQDLANSVTLEQALLILDVFAQARTRVRSRALSNPLVPLEMAVARLAGLESLTSLSEVIGKLEAVSRGAPLPQVTAAPLPIRQLVQTQAPVAEVAAPAPVESPVEQVTAPAEVKESRSAPDVEPQKPSAATKEIPAVSSQASDGAIENVNLQPIEAQRVEDSVADAPVNNSVTEPVAAVVQETQAAPQSDAIADEDRPPWEEPPEEQIADSGLTQTDEAAPSAEAVVEDRSSSPELTDGYYSNDDQDDDEAYLREQGLIDDAPVAAESAPSSEPVAQTAAGSFSQGGSVDLVKLWDAVREMLAQRSPADNSLLSDVHIEKLDGAELFLSVPGGGSFIFEQLEDKHRKGRLASCASHLLGREVEVRLNLREAIGEERPAGFRGREAEERSAAERDPAVQKLVRKFDGRITNIV